MEGIAGNGWPAADEADRDKGVKLAILRPKRHRDVKRDQEVLGH